MNSTNYNNDTINNNTYSNNASLNHLTKTGLTNDDYVNFTIFLFCAVLLFLFFVLDPSIMGIQHTQCGKKWQSLRKDYLSDYPACHYKIYTHGCISNVFNSKKNNCCNKTVKSHYVSSQKDESNQINHNDSANEKLININIESTSNTLINPMVEVIISMETSV